MTQSTTGSPTHDVTCADCGTLYACGRGHEPEIHEIRVARGWRDRCPSCARVNAERFYRTLPPLTQGPVLRPRICGYCMREPENCICAEQAHEWMQGPDMPLSGNLTRE